MKAWFLAAALALSCGGARAAAETAFQKVVVKRGDTLWSIAHHYLKDPAKWDELLKYNTLPSSDPTVALPGMTLRVPVALIKEDLRAARLVYKTNRVDFRPKETADWKATKHEMELFKGDALRTFESARARVKFLNSELLSLDPNSLVIIKPPKKDSDVELRTGSIFTGRSRVVTAAASITPKTSDTQYSTKIDPDFTTRVAVHRGLAAVEAQGHSVDVKAGMATEVKMGLAPAPPTKIPDMPDFEARAAEFNGQPIRRQASLGAGAVAASGTVAEEVERAPDAAGLSSEVSSLRIGVPISAYKLQASLSRDFQTISFDKTFEAEERLDLKYEKLQPGVYWFRIALVDLLGSQGRWSEPRLFSMGLRNRPAVPIDLKDVVKVAKPEDGETVTAEKYRVIGVIKSDRVTVAVAGKTVRQDDYGNFSVELKLKLGDNDIPIVVSDRNGNSTTIVRRVVYLPSGK